MSELRLISPLLDGFAAGGAISSHSGVQCYPAMKQDSDERYIIKMISIPASQVRLEALLLTGAYPDTAAAGRYFQDLAEDVQHEVETINKLAAQRGFRAFTGCQVVPMAEGVGYEIYLVSPYQRTLERQMAKAPLTHLSAVNMGIDLCAALAICREAGYLYVDVKPSNIFLPGSQEFCLGDLGFVAMDSLSYASLPDRYRSSYTAPEVSDAYSQLNATMDTYALGLVLYQVYNGGKLPFDSEESRNALLLRMAQGEVLPAPACADEQMAAIIAKACAYRPEDRYQSPAEMGHELIAYMQRNEINDVPILMPVAEPEPEPVEEPTAEAPEISAEEPQIAVEEPEITAEEPIASAPESVDEPQAEEVPADPLPEEPEDESEELLSDEDWIDRMDAILAEDPADEEAEEDDIPLRDLLTQDDENVDQILAEELSDETADMLTLAQELIDHEAPQPAVAPEPIDVPIPEPIVLADEEDDTDDEEALIAEVLGEEPPAPAAEEPVQEPKRKSSIGKKLLTTVLVLLLLAAAAFGGYYTYENYYLCHIDEVNVVGDGLSVTVEVGTDMDTSLLTVLCKDTSGTVQTGTLVNGQVTFDNLTPDTQYTISLEVSGFHKLTGNNSSKIYYTPPQTQITSLTASVGAEDGSAIISFGVEGPESSAWNLTYVTEGEEEQTVSFTGHSVTVTGLTVGSTYTFTLTGDEDLNLIGENTVEHTASKVIYAQNITVTGYQDGTITVSWQAPSDAEVSGWTARCYNEDGFDQKLDVTETTATFTDVEPSTGYTIEITAAGMVQSKLTYVTATPITVTSLDAQLSGSTIAVSWTYEGVEPSDDWLVVYTVDNGITQNAIRSSEASAVIDLLAPGSTYHITIQCADANTVFCDTVSVKVPAITTAFSGYRLSSSNIAVTSYEAPSSNSWTRFDLDEPTTEFAAGSRMALVYRTKSTYNITYDQIKSVFVIRDAEGNLTGISSRTRTWEAMWEGGYCTEEISQLPAESGSYTLEIYVDGGLLTTLDFSIK